MARTADPARRNEILNAARVAFRERGFAEAPMAEIAQRAGVASGTLYLYFPSKEALAQSLGAYYIEGLTNALLPYLSHQVRGAIAQAVHAALEYAIKNQDLLHFVHFDLGPGRKLARSEAEGRFCQLIKETLEDRVRRGELEGYDPEILAELLVGLNQWVAEQVSLHGKNAAYRFEETLVRLLQNGLVPATPRRPGLRSSRRTLNRKLRSNASNRGSHLRNRQRRQSEKG